MAHVYENNNQGVIYACIKLINQSVSVDNYIDYLTWAFVESVHNREHDIGINWHIETLLGRISTKSGIEKLFINLNNIDWTSDFSFYVRFMSKNELTTKVSLKDAIEWNNFFEEQKSTIIMASHFGNWEMNMVLFPLYVHRRVVAFYKPIKSKKMDDFMKAQRSKFGLELYPIESTLRIMQALKQENILYIFISDQSPLNINAVYWNTFLNQRTPWLNGAEKLAKKFDYPVVYLHQKPLENDSQAYQLGLNIISQNPKNESDGQIIETYSRLLEREIYDNPAFWLWSHKRWKRAQREEESV